MAVLAPELDDLARREGTAAAEAELAGSTPTACRWSTGPRTLFRERMRRAWTDAYMAARAAGGRPIPEPVVEE